MALAEAVVAAPADSRDWSLAPLGELIQHILDRYHAPLRQDLPQLSRMSQKVADVHGGRHPELKRMAEVYSALRAELEPHLRKEEQVLFPFLATLEGADAGRHPLMGAAEHPIGAMQMEHENAGAALEKLRQLSGGYRLPEDACNTWRGLYHGLEQLERDLHEHIHLENNALFPHALEIERALLQGAGR
jgi:regulator of cell morphogenesis and NO signaling